MLNDTRSDRPLEPAEGIVLIALLLAASIFVALRRENIYQTVLGIFMSLGAGYALVAPLRNLLTHEKSALTPKELMLLAENSFDEREARAKATLAGIAVGGLIGGAASRRGIRNATRASNLRVAVVREDALEASSLAGRALSRLEALGNGIEYDSKRDMLIVALGDQRRAVVSMSIYRNKAILRSAVQLPPFASRRKWAKSLEELNSSLLHALRTE